MAPSVPNIKGLEQEYQDSLSCPECYPECSSVDYSRDANSNKIEKNPTGGLLSGLNSTEDLAIIRVYFAEQTGLLYKTTVIMTWYELLSTFGGLTSLVLGSSVITLIELIYFGCYRFYQYLHHDFDNERDDLKISLRQEMFPKKHAKLNYSAVERSLYDEYQRRHFPHFH